MSHSENFLAEDLRHSVVVSIGCVLVCRLRCQRHQQGPDHLHQWPFTPNKRPWVRVAAWPWIRVAAGAVQCGGADSEISECARRARWQVWDGRLAPDPRPLLRLLAAQARYQCLGPLIRPGLRLKFGTVYKCRRLSLSRAKCLFLWWFRPHVQFLFCNETLNVNIL